MRALLATPARPAAPVLRDGEDGRGLAAMAGAGVVRPEAPRRPAALAPLVTRAPGALRPHAPGGQGLAPRPAPPADAGGRALLAPSVGPAPVPVAERLLAAWRRDLPLPVLLALGAVAINLLVSGNLLILLHIPYATDGGNFLVKLHPGTYLAMLSLLAACWRAPGPLLGRMVRRAPVPALFLLAMVGCFVWAGAMTGKARLVVFIENFMPAAILAMVLRDASPRAMRLMGVMILGLIALSVPVAVLETALHRHLVPVALNAGEVEHETDFRPTGLFDHPLTAAMMGMIGLFLASSPRLPFLVRSVMLPLMGLGLLAFGGRTALVLSVLLFGAWQAWELGRRLLQRRLTAADVLLVPALGVLVPLLALVVLTQTSLGERIATHFYWDESAQVRSVQWNIVGMMEPRELLFGMTLEAQERATHQLGLAWRIQVIENFWLLLFLYLGAIGFALFAAGFALMLGWTWRRGAANGRLMLLGVLLAASTSNSLGRKANILTVLVPAVMSTAFLAEPRRRRG